MSEECRLRYLFTKTFYLAQFAYEQHRRVVMWKDQDCAHIWFPTLFNTVWMRIAVCSFTLYIKMLIIVY